MSVSAAVLAHTAQVGALSQQKCSMIMFIFVLVFCRMFYCRLKINHKMEIANVH
jgi:hypothetical protein